MDKTQFLKYLNEQVRSLKVSWKLNDGRAFGMWLALEYLGLDETEAFECISYDGGNDKDIDLFYLDHEIERVTVGQLKFNNRGVYKGKKNELLGAIHTTDWLKDPEALARDGRTDLESLAIDYGEAIGRGYSVEYLYCYCGPESKDVMDAARQFNVTEAGNIPSRSCRILTLESLKTYHEEKVVQGTRVDTAEIALGQSGSYEEKGAYGTAFVTTLGGEQLRELHEKHGDRLFDRNVRLFLGARKGGVNAGIRDTLLAPSERKNFWAYNNGVTFVCDRYDKKPTNKPTKIVLHNFSIVNGCQTTVSLANATSAAVKDTKVLVRIIAAPERVIDSVIRFTNSQNPIRVWDLNAQDKLQKRIKRDLASLPQPFFYLLRKGETQQLSTVEKQKFRRDGKLQAIVHDLNAQYLAAFHGLPAVAYKDKGKIFSAFRDEVFPPQIRAEEVVLSWQAGKVTKDLIRAELEQAAQNEDEGRLSILKRGATFFTLAVIGILLHERNGKTFLNKLAPEVAASKATQERLKKYATIALEWYVETMSDLVAVGGNVASLVRTQEGWQKIRPRILSKWKVYRVAKNVMEDALPKL